MHSTSQGFGVPLGPPGTSTPLSANLGSSSAAFASLVIFRVRVGESFGFGEDVYVCGNTPTLGNFDPERGVQLFATTRNYPFFESAVVPLPRGKPIEYKYAIFVGGIFDRWESIDYNRCITADELAQNTDTNMQGRMSSDMDSEIADIVTHMTNDSLGITPENPPDLTTSETLNSMTPTPTTVFGRHYSPVSSRFPLLFAESGKCIASFTSLLNSFLSHWHTRPTPARNALHEPIATTLPFFAAFPCPPQWKFWDCLSRLILLQSK